MKHVQLYTDGACRGNPGRGGWGAILVYLGHEKELSGGEAETTNNRMELTAVIAGLSSLRERCRVTVYSDSRYVVNAYLERWIEEWEKTDFHRGKVKNPDLWRQLLALTRYHEVTFSWVKGHNGHAYNERCDALATAFADRFPDTRADKTTVCAPIPAQEEQAEDPVSPPTGQEAAAPAEKDCPAAYADGENQKPDFQTKTATASHERKELP